MSLAAAYIFGSSVSVMMGGYIFGYFETKQQVSLTPHSFATLPKNKYVDIQDEGSETELREDKKNNYIDNYENIEKKNIDLL